MPEAAVEQVEHRVLGAADVEVDRHPVAFLLGVPGTLVVRAGRCSAGNTSTTRPTGASCWSRGGPCPSSGPTPSPCSSGGSGLPVGLKSSSSGRRTGSSRLGDARGSPILLVEHDRERLAPVALAGEQPVAQLVVDRLLAEPALLEPGGDRGLRLGGGQAVEEIESLRELTDDARLGLGLGQAGRRPDRARGATTRTIGRSNAWANSKSRSSCAGTAMIAPVP